MKQVEIKGDCYVVGDIHREANALALALSMYDISNCTIILLGDIGIWRYRDYKAYKKLDDCAKERNIIIYAFRGNHDNPAFFRDFDNRSPVVTRFWNKFSNFKVLPDLTEVIINDMKGIIIGGGVSIDRCCRHSYLSSYRRGGVYNSNDWWEDETVPSTDNIDKEYDFILSHTGPRPLKIAPLNESNCSFFKRDASLKYDIDIENNRLIEIAKQFKPKKWWFGHYHINDSFDFDNIRCYAVDILNLCPIR